MKNSDVVEKNKKNKKQQQKNSDAVTENKMGSVDAKSRQLMAL